MTAPTPPKVNPSFLPAAPLAPTTLVKNIVDLFHLSLVEGKLHPGEEINESQVAQSLGVARGTLREAIHTLVSEGILEKSAHRHTRVIELSPQKAWEITTVRAVVESYCARVLAERMTPERAHALNAIWQDMDAAAHSGNGAAFTQCDFRLHEAIVELSGHELFGTIWSNLGPWIRLMFASVEYSAEDLIKNSQDHRLVIRAIQDGTPDEAEKRLRADLLDQNELRRIMDLSSYPA